MFVLRRILSRCRDRLPPYLLVLSYPVLLCCFCLLVFSTCSQRPLNNILVLFTIPLMVLCSLCGVCCVLLCFVVFVVLCTAASRLNNSNDSGSSSSSDDKINNAAAAPAVATAASSSKSGNRSSSQSTSWVCASCTYLNASLRLKKCTVCQHSRIDKGAPPPGM